MGKIFGISDLPVSTIMTPFESIVILQNPAIKEIEYAEKVAKKMEITQDRFIPKALTRARIPSFLSMKNGFGKLMHHLSDKLVK